MKAKKLLALLLALCMVFALVACGSSDSSSSGDDSASAAEEPAAEESAEEEPAEAEEAEEPAATGTSGNTALARDAWEFDQSTYDDDSWDIYEDILGEFYDNYLVAKDCSNLSERYALMATSEAKLLEACVMLPNTSDGGTFQASRYAPRSVATVGWGVDSYRYHTMVCTEEPISNEDWDAMKEMWYDLQGTGTYNTAAIDYLTEHGYTLSDTYTSTFSTTPNTWDILNTQRQSDSQYICNTLDFLVHYDSESVLQPGLAESWEVSDDGLTYTFHIREGVEWVDSQGRSTGYTVCADDWVAAAQHMMDDGAGLADLLDGIVEGIHEYWWGETTDMDVVGIKALDEYTLQYTLCEPCPYFMTMLTYNEFAPMCRGYYESQGGKFGDEFDAEDPSYVYGTSYENIAYCGPFLVTQVTEQSKFTLEQNPTYWNNDGIVPSTQPHITTYTMIYNDGSDQQKYVDDFLNGTTSALTCTDARLALLSQDFIDENVHLSDTGATSYQIFLNLNRNGYSNFNDASKMQSQMTVDDAERTNAAMQNVHFRLALCSSIDRETYNSIATGEDAKLASLRNTYTPGNFVFLDEDVTIDINGTAVTFSAGTYYGEILQAQLDADDFPVQVWNEENKTTDGMDSWYDPDRAAAELDLAIEELAAQGIEVSAENPIYVELNAWSSNETYYNRANVVKQSIEAATDGRIIVTLLEDPEVDNWYYACYYTDYGYQENYTLNDCTGWGPDYGDPSTYLDTMLPDYSGYDTIALGIF